MIIFFSVVLKDLFKLERNYPWPMLDTCPRCRASGLWGHGYVTAYFDGFSMPLIIKRYRCPSCGCVIRLRPKGYFSRIQTPIKTIRLNIYLRIRTGRWPPGLTRNRQGHWVRALKRRVLAFFGVSFKQSLLKAFDHFILQGVIPVSRSI